MNTETNPQPDFLEMHAAVEKAYQKIRKSDKETAEFIKGLFDTFMNATVATSLVENKHPGKVLAGLCYMFAELDRASDRIAERQAKTHLN